MGVTKPRQRRRWVASSASWYKNMRNLARPSWLRRFPGLGYAVVVLGVTAAIVADHLLEKSLQTIPTLFLFLTAIIFSAWLGGVGPGLTATVLSLVAFDYFFLSQTHTLDLMLG